MTLSALTLYFVFPVAFMLLRSVMTEAEASSVPVAFFPQGFNYQSYVKIFREDYWLYTLNTLKIALINIVTMVFTASLSAYGFARIKFKGRGPLFAVMLATLMLPAAVSQIPLYVLYARFGWIDTHYPFIIPKMFGGGAINIFLIIQFMRSVPKELDEAAEIDGAGVFRRYVQITMPLCVPILIYITVNIFNGAWGDFNTPKVFLQTKSKFTLAMGIYYQSFLGGYQMAFSNLRMAAGVFMTVIPAILFFVFQKRLVEGINIGAVKG